MYETDNLGSIWIQLILLKTKNWKHCNKIIFKCVKNYCSLFFYCSYALVHCPCPTNSAPSAGLLNIKKKMLKTRKRENWNVNVLYKLGSNVIWCPSIIFQHTQSCISTKIDNSKYLLVSKSNSVDRAKLKTFEFLKNLISKKQKHKYWIERRITNCTNACFCFGCLLWLDQANKIVP